MSLEMVSDELALFWGNGPRIKDYTASSDHNRVTHRLATLSVEKNAFSVKVSPKIDESRIVHTCWLPAARLEKNSESMVRKHVPADLFQTSRQGVRRHTGFSS
jgi:hypothetical protein